MRNNTIGTQDLQRPTWSLVLPFVVVVVAIVAVANDDYVGQRRVDVG